MKKLIFLVLIFSLAFFLGVVESAEYYVDSEKGNDSWDGLSIESAWQTLERVNLAELAPGDFVRFKKDGLWRGTLKPKSGSEGRPITYTSFGKGEKPRIYGSVHLKSCWTPAGENLWTTPKDTAESTGEPTSFLAGKWSVHSEQGAKLSVISNDAKEGLRIRVSSPGDAVNHIQLINAPFPIESGKVYAAKFQIETSTPFILKRENFRLHQAGAPYAGYGDAAFMELEKKSDGITEYRLWFRAARSAEDARLTVYLGGIVAADDELKLKASASFGALHSLQLSLDVGNLIFDGQTAGRKCWNRDTLKNQGDFFYDAENNRVVLFSKGSPEDVYRMVEAALKRHVIDMSGTSHCVFDGFDIRYGAAHGFGGSNTANYVIRGCDLSWIGGGHQLTRPDGQPVRYGNAIEFWSNARDHVVENNRIWEVYDAALTNQGDGVNVQKNIVYRGNEVWNSEYSFEYWNRGPESVTENIVVENNRFRDAGFGWGHTQRPDPNGRHLMFYDNPAKTSGFRIVGNRFEKATDSIIRLEATRGQESPDHRGDSSQGWVDALELDRNEYVQDADKPVVRWLGKDYDFEEFQKATGKERDGVFSRPQ